MEGGPVKMHTSRHEWRSFRGWGLVALALCLAISDAPAQMIMSGRVVESETGLGIPAAVLALIDADGDTVNAALGNERAAFRMVVAEIGSYSLSVQRIGYAPLLLRDIELESRADLEMEIRMGLHAIPLDPVSVITRRPSEPLRLREFRARAETQGELGRRTFYLREDLERLRPVTAQQLLATTSWSPQCEPTILLDGLRASEAVSALRLEELAGVEIYRDPTQIPPEFYRSGMCGLAVFWTRADAPDARPLSWKRLGIVASLVAMIALFSR